MSARPTVRVATEDTSPPSAPQPPKPATAQTDRILAILQHALGRDQHGKPRKGYDYRNHFCAGGDDLATCREAVSLGLMQEHPASAISGGYPVFTVTAAGKKYIAEHSPPEPKLSPGQKRYRRWLHVEDATGETFGEWLKRESKRRGQDDLGGARESA